MAVAAAALGRFEIGRVATRTFEVIRGNFLSFFVLGLLATLPATAYSVATTIGALPSTLAGADARTVTLFLAGTLGSALVGAFCGVILQATLTYGTVSYLNNQPVVLSRALGIGLREFLPLFAIALLEGLGIAGGFLLLIVPGFMLYVMWAVVVPVRVAEHKGVFESFGRSRALTEGYRWPIFGTLIVFYLGAGVAQATTRPMIVAGGIAGGSASPMLYVGIVLTSLLGAVVAVVSATLISCIYYELRLIKEGVGPEQIASVFE
jgi:hypothetical protein